MFSLAAVPEDGCLQCLREFYHRGHEIPCVRPVSARVVPYRGGHEEEHEKKAVDHVL